jgi:hypothetical protein
MKLPNTLTIRAKGTSGMDVSGIIFVITVFSGTKNPYYIMFPMTDARGIARLTSEQFRGQFEDYSDEGLMDYCRNDRLSMDPASWQVENRSDIELEIRPIG